MARPILDEELWSLMEPLLPHQSHADSSVPAAARWTAHMPGQLGGDCTGPSPVDRRRSGSKDSTITDTSHIPLAVKLTGGHGRDVTQWIPLVDRIPPIAGIVGNPACRTKAILGDRPYDSQSRRNQLRDRGIEAILAQRNTDHSSGLGVVRWMAERTIRCFTNSVNFESGMNLGAGRTSYSLLGGDH